MINASARTQVSHSRYLTKEFVDQWQELHPVAVITARELGNENIPHISEDWIRANLKAGADRSISENELLSLSNTYITELKDADIIILGTPMYNWSIPSALKAYIDQIMRLNETFSLNTENHTQPYTGLLQNKIMVLLVARGGMGYETGEQNAHLDFQTTYLKTVFNMTGIRQIHIISISGTSMDKEQLRYSIEQAKHNITLLVAGISEQ